MKIRLFFVPIVLTLAACGPDDPPSTFEPIPCATDGDCDGECITGVCRSGACLRDASVIWPEGTPCNNGAPECAGICDDPVVLARVTRNGCIMAPSSPAYCSPPDAGAS